MRVVRRLAPFVAAAVVAGATACGTSADDPADHVPRSTPVISTPAGRAVTAVGPAETFRGSANSVEGASPAVSTVELPPRETYADRFVPPVKDWSALLDPFGSQRRDGFVHAGVDIGMEGKASSPVLAVCAGTVAVPGGSDAYGLHLAIDCGDGWSVLLGFLGDVRVPAGEQVARGAVIALSDSTGGHIHLEVRYNGTPVDPVTLLGLPATPATPTVPAPSRTATPNVTPSPTATLAPGQPTNTPGPPTATPTPRPPTPTPTITPTPTRTPTPLPTRRPSPTPSPTLPILR